MIAAGALIVIDVETSPMSMPANSRSMSSRVSIATPSRPTSPSERAWSESWPISDGMSNAGGSPASGRGYSGRLPGREGRGPGEVHRPQAGAGVGGEVLAHAACRHGLEHPAPQPLRGRLLAVEREPVGAQPGDIGPHRPA